MNNKTKITKFENGFIEISDLDTMLNIKIKPGASRTDIEDSFSMARYIRQLISELNGDDYEHKGNDRAAGQ